MQVEPKTLVRRLTSTATQCLEAAVGAGASAGHYEITVEHLLLQLLVGDTGQPAAIFQEHGRDRRGVVRQLEKTIQLMRTGHSGRPTFSQTVFQWIEEAWVVGSLELGHARVCTGVLLAQLIRRRGSYLDDHYPELDEFPGNLIKELPDIIEASDESPGYESASDSRGPATSAPGGGGDTAISRFTQNLTDQAKEGRIDPVLGRHREIRQVIDILSRRRKNNPVITGEPGVGKTALVEGLALAIAAGEVPPHLANVKLLSLDLGSLQAGASVRGEFESRLKQLIGEVKASPEPIVLFIDEAHMLVGAGGQQGGGDAANLLKPALARGELRTIAATTWAEYKKYFEKDAALERRFQPVKVDEPGEDAAIAMLRGLTARLEDTHGVIIRDEAVVDAVQLSSRYVAGRQLPDKAIDLLDTASARVRTSMKARPEAVVELEQALAGLEREESALLRDVADKPALQIRLDALRQELATGRDKLETVRARWDAERAEVERWLAERQDPSGPLSPPAVCAEDPLVQYEVGSQAVAQAVSSWTGIPVGKMKADKLSAVLDLEASLSERVFEQDDAALAVADAVRMSQSGIRNPNAPVGVLLFVGPTGVGKTEMALALADLLYGGERFLTVINMTEFQEKHTVSRLIGSPPGYVGYGEGGVLSEAVRQRPYSVVLLDECEKADLEVMNLFYQVFDKGQLSDGEGRVIDFRHTLVILTSNLAADAISAAYSGDGPTSSAAVVEQIRPALADHFKPALLARMSIVPFRPVGEKALRRIAEARLAAIGDRVKAAHGVEFGFSKDLIDDLVKRSLSAVTGARTVDHVLRGAMMPALARFLLERMAGDSMPGSIVVGRAADGHFTFSEKADS